MRYTGHMCMQHRILMVDDNSYRGKKVLEIIMTTLFIQRSHAWKY